MLALLDGHVDRAGAVLGKRLPFNCASTSCSSSVKDMSIGTPMPTPPGVGGTMRVLSGNGQSGLVWSP